MTPEPDAIERLLALLEAAADSVSELTDEEVQAMLAEQEQRPGPSLGEIIAGRPNEARSQAAINAGEHVRLKTNPTRAGIVLPGERVQAGRRMLPVQFPDGTVRSLPASALELVPAAAAPIADRYAAGRFADPEWLRRTLARIRVTGRLTWKIHQVA
jgi:hypothetical protein